eukprot:61049-Pelagomonas_calceolata.AAC.5
MKHEPHEGQVRQGSANQMLKLSQWSCSSGWTGLCWCRILARKAALSSRRAGEAGQHWQGPVHAQCW